MSHPHIRVLGVDPGLTRCGIGVVEGSVGKQLSLVGVGVILTPVDAPLEKRLLQLEAELEEWISLHKPDVIAVERVFSQHNVRTVMGTGQAAGIALLVAARTALQTAGIDYESADSSFLPSMQIPLDAEGAQKVFELIDAIEELDDVQNVYSNFDVSDEVMASLS